MKNIADMTLEELAAYVCDCLCKNGVEVTLSGGACVSIYSHNKYASCDLDFIENIFSSTKKIRVVLSALGFVEQHRYFAHPQTSYLVEFPPGPLTVGDEPVRDIQVLSYSTGMLRILSATDCIKDRLAGYYHWDDLQCLEQAVLVAQNNSINLAEIQRWSEQEGKINEFLKIKGKFKQQA
jgi:hypothetical protein